MSELKYAAIRHWHSQGLSIAEIIAKCASNGIKSKHGTLPGKTTIHDWIHGRTIESQSDPEQDPVEDLFAHTRANGERVIQSPNREHNLKLILSWHRAGLTTSDIIAQCSEHQFLNRSFNQPSPNTIKYWIRKAEELVSISTTEELAEDSQGTCQGTDQGTDQERIKYLEETVQSLINLLSNLVDSHCGLVSDLKTLKNKTLKNKKTMIQEMH
jgi:DNA-binding transcriptional MerR regulator